MVLAGVADPGPRLLPAGPPPAVAGRAGQLVARDPPAVEPHRHRTPYQRYPAGLLSTVALLDLRVRGFRRRDAEPVRAHHGGRCGVRDARGPQTRGRPGRADLRARVR